MHRKHGIDRCTEGSGAWKVGRVSQWVWGAPSSGKVTTYFQHIVLPLIFRIWFGVFPIGTARSPIQLQSTTLRPDCAWTVGIASARTESVGIVWCTRVYLVYF